jgi:hypothetical protein
VLSPRIWLLGVPVPAGIFFWRLSPLLVLMAVLATPQALKAGARTRKRRRTVSTTRCRPKRVAYALYDLGLLAFLAVMAHDTHEMLGALR